MHTGTSETIPRRFLAVPSLDDMTRLFACSRGVGIAALAGLLAASGCAKNPAGDDDDDAPPRPDGGMPPTMRCEGSGMANQPFGNHARAYATGAILPEGDAAERDAAVIQAYRIWKDRYVTQGCGDGRYYVRTGMDGHLTVSEAHGYGMVITAYMAGPDPDARTVFDGMFRYFRDHPSSSTSELMAWSQDAACRNNEGPDSASDGDLDIAYALLLADKQWGSSGDIDYHAEALKVLGGISRGDLDRGGSYILLGDWATPGDPQYDATRTSDFMPSHLRSFGAASGDPVWAQVADRTYTMVAALQAGPGADTGLLPDFVLSPLTEPRPAGPDFLEGAADGAYSWNACRDPWRLAMDFLLNGDARARDAVQKINGWLQRATGGDPGQIGSGYQLGGDRLPNREWRAMAFMAPFAVGAMVDGANQQWLNALWPEILGEDDNEYYADTLKMLALVALSGNWWSPEAAPCR